MKFIQTLLVAAICGGVFSFGANALAQDKPGYATVVRIKGEARYSRGDNQWHPLTVGQTLSAGCVVQTAVDSSVDLVLGQKIPYHINPNPTTATVAPAPDSEIRGMAAYKATAAQNVIRMQPDTVLAVDKLTIGNTGVDAVSDTELDLRKGTIFGNVKKLSAASQYLIKIPNGIAGVRGTTFVMSASGAITVVEGSMILSIKGSNGKLTTVSLGTGDQFDISTGQVTHLSPDQLANARGLAVEAATVIHGITRFAVDHTIVYVSPTGSGASSQPPQQQQPPP